MGLRREYLKRAWYVAALSSEVTEGTLLARKLLDTPVVLYRDKQGQVVALHDRCPHRFAPLSMGKLEQDEVVCPYHGLRFDGTGVCTHNPHGKGHIPAAAQVRAFPLLERYGFVWIWFDEGDPDPSVLPDFSPLTEGHPNAVGYTYMPLDCNYELIIDNVMDLSHIDHVHGELITTRGKLSPIVPELREAGGKLSARWEWSQTPAMLIFANFLAEPEAEARHYFDITWSAPANIQLSVGAVQGDADFDQAVAQYDLHTATPADAFTTHYFFATRRNHNVEDAEYNAMKIKGMHDTFHLEDGPLVRAVQERMGAQDFFELDPVLMSNDVAAMRVRRRLQKLIQAEQSASGAMPRLPVIEAE